MRGRATALVRQSAGEEAAASQENGGSSARERRSTWLLDAIAGAFSATGGTLVRRAPKTDSEMKCVCIKLVELMKSMRLTDLRLPTSSILRLKYTWRMVAKIGCRGFSSRQEHRAASFPTSVRRTCWSRWTCCCPPASSSSNRCGASNHFSLPSPGPSTWSSSSVPHRAFPRLALDNDEAESNFSPE